MPAENHLTLEQKEKLQKALKKEIRERILILKARKLESLTSMRSAVDNLRVML